MELSKETHKEIDRLILKWANNDDIRGVLEEAYLIGFNDCWNDEGKR